MNNDEPVLVIQGGRIIDPDRGIDRIGDVIISEGRILQVADGVIRAHSPEFMSRAQSLDATGLVVCPGFVDLHCHLREPGYDHKETIRSGTEAAARGGFTTVCCMGNTDPPLDTPATVRWVHDRAAGEAMVRVLPIGCVTRGRRGLELTDMAGLAGSGVVAFSDDGDPVPDSQLMRDAMLQCRSLGLPLVDHCEDRALSRDGVMNEGRLATELGLKGIPPAAEEVMVDRDLRLAKLTGARVHIAHVSTRGSVELIRLAREEGVPVTAEVTPHHLTLTENSVRSNGRSKMPDTYAKVNPPLRTEADIEALLVALSDGTIDAIATDHAPHAAADKECSFEVAAFGISGFETAFGCLMSLVRRGEISLGVLISRLTRDPARVIGRDGELGTLSTGAPASITILDPERDWIVDSRSFASRGRNTPYEGHRLKGKVMATIAEGRIVYRDEAVPYHEPRR